MTAPASVSTEALHTTYCSCDWLVQIAEQGVKLGTTPPDVMRWLLNLHAHCAEDLRVRGYTPGEALP